MVGKVKILIADDHPIFREGIVKNVGQDPNYEIVAQCGEGIEVIGKIKELNPDIAIIDISMPGMSGLEVVRKSLEEKLSVDFIILTMYKDEEYFNEALGLGVMGYLLKDNAVKLFKSSIPGKSFYLPGIIKSVNWA